LGIWCLFVSIRQKFDKYPFDNLFSHAPGPAPRKQQLPYKRSRHSLTARFTLSVKHVYSYGNLNPCAVSVKQVFRRFTALERSATLLSRSTSSAKHFWQCNTSFAGSATLLSLAVQHFWQCSTSGSATLLSRQRVGRAS